MHERMHLFAVSADYTHSTIFAQVYFGHEPNQQTQHMILGPPHASTFTARRRGVLRNEATYVQELFADACAAVDDASTLRARL